MIANLEKLAHVIASDESLRQIASCEIAGDFLLKEQKLPLHVFTLGSRDPKAPVFLITGGFHGLERIGAQLAWSLLKTTIERLAWDNSLKNLMQNIRLVIVPLMNPVGYFNNSRCNGNGVDLMRNSPVKAEGKVPYLLGGQRISNKLPWFQGEEGKLERENEILLQIFTRECLQSRAVLAIDFHSGFGMKDRLWFPYSCKPEPFENLAEMAALTDLFEQTHPYHIYQIEPQSKGYLLHGDVWDHLYFQFREANPHGVFLPLTLEMGSWTWVRKNPAQLFSVHGVFNPIKEHRVKRVYRRHNLLFDFMMKAVNSHEVWSKLDRPLRQQHERVGLERWY